LLWFFFLGAYALALMSGLALLAVPFVAWSSGIRLGLLPNVLFLTVGAAVLGALRPRQRRFQPPGIEVFEQNQSSLFALMKSVSAASDAPLPSRVFLVAGMGAAVRQVGGLLGFGGTHVMQVGFGMLQVLNVSEARSVIAHEMGHLLSQDTTSGTRVVLMRDVLIQMIEAMHGSTLQLPMILVCEWYLEQTRAAGRQRELKADELAVLAVGPAVFQSALKKVVVHHHLYARFVEAVVSKTTTPVNFFEAYRAFVKSDEGQALKQKAATAHEFDIPMPFDTHPSLEERLEAAGKTRGVDRPVDARPAVDLLKKPADLERDLSLWMRADFVKNLIA
jgi:heat shock protein HtpX